jgi:hypothetical protein
LDEIYAVLRTPEKYIKKWKNKIYY